MLSVYTHTGTQRPQKKLATIETVYRTGEVGDTKRCRRELTALIDPEAPR